MNSNVSIPHRAAAVALTLATLLFVQLTPAQAQQSPGVVPRKASPNGQTYGEWSASWWKWFMELPPGPGHPAVDDPSYNLATGQSGNVWFLGSPFGTVERSSTIPAGTSLFIGVVNAEGSSLEGLGDIEADQRASAEFLANHINDPFCTVDGVAVRNMSSYRISSPQFSFTAPTPWIFGDTGGSGTAVSDGYFLMLAPLSAGQHTIHYGGSFHFAVAEGDPFDFDGTVDTTYHLTVQ
jgi:hypothetical protein